MDPYNYSTALVLNARVLPSNVRHEVVFKVLDALPSRHRVTLINDHDPKPLFYQLDAEQPGAFTRQVVDPPQANLFAVVVTRIRAKLREIQLVVKDFRHDIAK